MLNDTLTSTKDSFLTDSLTVYPFRPDESYQSVHQRMLALVNQRIDNDINDCVMIGEHPPSITCGRKTSPDNIINPGNLPIIPIERGGDVTYHGPGQLVIYPIIKLHNHDLHAYLRQCEQLIIEVLADCGVEANRHHHTTRNATGVWVLGNNHQPLKIASIGVAVKRWVTYHGIAINISNDLAAYNAINPCGFNAEVMTRLVDHL
jgi:lipoate-protein ligase B